MNKSTYLWIALVALLSILLGSTALAQTTVKSWGFESSLESWAVGTDNSAITLSTDKAATGTQSCKLVKPASGTQINLQNDVFKDVKEGDEISVKVWISATDLADVNGLQVFWQDGSGWTWHAIWVNGSDLTGGAWTTIKRTFTAIASPLQRIGYQLALKSGTDAKTPTMYVDDITITRPAVGGEGLVSQWGSFGGRRGGAGTTNVWKIVNSTTAGNSGIAGSKVPANSWASIRGGFGAPVTATTEKAIVVTGSVEFVGSGPTTWSGLRYGLFRHDSIGTVVDAGTDSARWSGKENYGYGYMFSPHSGANDNPSWASGGSGTQGVNNNGSSPVTTYGGPSLGVINQAPVLAKFDAGKYDWAISVQPLANGDNEVRFYMIKQGTPVTYWWGGTVVNSPGVTTTFNGVCFALDPNYDQTTSPISAMNLTNVKVQLGTPITVPEAPWVAFYISQWGSFGGRRGGAGTTNVWKIVNDPDSITGNSGIAGSKVPANSWASIRGGFPVPVKATTSKAIIVTGSIEFVGSGPTTWSGLRYGLFRHDSIGTLQYYWTDSAAWSGKENYGYGYMFSPHSGANDNPSWASGGSGTQGVNNNGSSPVTTYGGPSLGVISQAPALAKFDAGKYDWAISVQPLANGDNEVRFYMIKQGTPVTYWWGGTVVNSPGVTTTFNGVCFALDPNYDQTTSPISAMKLTDVKVDIGSPITVPEPPWVAYYIDQWGLIGGRMYGWNFIRDPEGIFGNAGIGGTAPNQKWAAIRGGFFSPISPTTAKALVVTGKVEFVGGGFEAVNSFRFGTFYSESAGKVIVDSAVATLPDSTRWDGLETYHSGYLFIPPSGTNGLADWTGLSAKASSGAVVNGAWLHNDYPAAAAANLTSNYVLGTEVQTPANAIGTKGVYNFAISVASGPRGANDVRYKLAKSDNSYSITGKLNDTQMPLAAVKFNSVNFAIGRNPSTTAMKLTDVLVDYVDVAKVPITSYGAGVTSVGESGGIVPMEFALGQNYPNPFNPSTTITYDIAKAAHVTIQVYDVLGRMVGQLVNAVQSPSRYALQWNPAGLSSGTYLYRIDARYEDGSGNFSAVKKLIYMK